MPHHLIRLLTPLLLGLACAGDVPAQAPPTVADAGVVEQRLIEATRATPDSFAAHRALAGFYLAARQPAEALPSLERARALDPSNYDNGYDLAVAYLHTGRLDAAREQVQRMLAAKESAELRNLLGDIDVEAGDRRAAAVDYQLAARQQPTEEHLFDWGDNLIHLQAHADAIAVFTAAVRRFPESARLHIGLGTAHYAQGQYADAVQAFCRATDIEPADPAPYGFLGELYGVSPDHAADVTRRLARFAELVPDNASAHFFYAMNLWKGGAADVDLARVEALLRRAIALDADFGRAQLQLGILLSEQQRWKEAVPALERAVALFPESAQGHFRLASAYRRTGQSALADQELAIFERLKAREPATAPPPPPR